MSKLIRSSFAVGLAALALRVAVGVVAAAVLTGIGSQSPVRLTPGDSKDPDIAVSGNITHAVWTESGGILHSRNSGLTWTSPITVATGDDPSLIVDRNGALHLAFTESSSPTINVYYTRFVSPTWLPPLQVSGGANNTSLPDIAAAPNGNLYIVWGEQTAAPQPQVEIAESTNGGSTWPSVAPVGSVVGEVSGNAPKIAVGADAVQHVVWQDTTNPTLRIKHTQRATTTWTIPAFVSDASSAAYSPDLVAMSGKAHVIWQQSSGATATIRYAHGTGLLWSTPVTLSAASESASEPAIAASTYGALIAAWDSGVTITLRMGGVGGWSNPQILGTDASNVGHVALAAGPNGIVHAVFAKGAGGSRDIWHNTFTTKGVYLPLVMKNSP